MVISRIGREVKEVQGNGRKVVHLRRGQFRGADERCVAEAEEHACRNCFLFTLGDNIQVQ
ncbi:MAG: hypothetical protein D6806_13270 [Deltaproteobacteria bacterium]|nr:MAG: hypothetical protein D6806_13270 [Deltaproteobacteria bacterium]